MRLNLEAPPAVASSASAFFGSSGTGNSLERDASGPRSGGSAFSLGRKAFGR
jgi:hypothetical protein